MSDENILITELQQIEARENMPVEGYRHDEVHISFVEKEQPADLSIAGNEVGINKEFFTKQDAGELWDEVVALGLGLPYNAPSFPFMSIEKPVDISWTYIDLESEPAKLSNLTNTYLVERDSDGKTTFKVRGLDIPGIAEIINVDASPELKEHLDRGYCAYVQVSGFFVSWLPVPEYFANLTWDIVQATYKRDVGDWKNVIRMLDEAKAFDLALTQSYKFSVLPYQWHSENTVAPTGIAIDTSKAGRTRAVAAIGAKHDVHLCIEQPYNDGKAVRLAGEWLCGNQEEASELAESDDMLYIYQNSYLVKKLNRGITCAGCLDVVNEHIDLQQ